MHTTLMARIFLDTLALLEAEVDTPQKAEEFKAFVFESAEGELALKALERTLGLALVPAEVVTQHWEFGPVSVDRMDAIWADGWNFKVGLA
jgi:hypothetical protein